MPTNYVQYPDGTTLTGWSKTGGTFQQTADGLRWYGSGSHTLTIDARSTVPRSVNLGMALTLRRNTSGGSAVSVLRLIGDFGYVTTYPRVALTDLPVGAFITMPLSNRTQIVDSAGGARIQVTTVGGAYDFTVKDVGIYELSDAPASAVIDSNDAEFTWTQADNSLTAAFTKSPGNEAVDQVSWAWGHGSPTVADASTGRVQTHAFPARGRYTVQLTSKNTVGATSDVAGSGDAAKVQTAAGPSQVVTVPMGPFVADFQAEINYLALSVDASPSVSPANDPIDLYTWAWGDGTTSTGKLQSHTYAQPGSYAVSLTISTTATQRSHTSTQTVVATTPPNPANYFTVNKSLLQVTLAPSITNGTSYLWSFGDGTTSTVQAPTYAYATAGTYTITLTVNGNLTTSQTVVVTDTYKALKIPDALRLEVAVPPALGVIYNRLKNPDGVQGAWGWQTPTSGSTAIGSSTSDQPYDKAVSGAKLVYTSSGSGTQILQSTPVLATAGQYVGAQFICTYVEGFYRATVDALSSAGAVLGSSGTTGYLSALGTAQRTVGYLLPTGTVAVRVRINHYSNTSAGTPAAGAILQLRHVMLAQATTQALVNAVPYAEADNWQNVLGSTTSMSIDREALNVGTFTARIADSALDPATASTIRPGQGVRLRAAVPDASGNVVWKNLYRGTLTNAKVKYEGKRPSEITSKSTKIDLSATDAVTRLAQDGEPRGVALVTELPELLESTTVPYEVNGSSGQVPAVNVVAWNENASVLDQVAITRDTSQGVAYVSRNNVLVVRDPQHLPTAPAGVVSEEQYSGIDATFDTDGCMNSVTVKWLRYTPAGVDGEGNPTDPVTEEILYGPYEDAASIDTWGFHPVTFTMQGVENPTAIAAKAAAILAANKTPVRRINSVTIPIRYVEDLHEGKALLDLADLVQLAYARTSTNEPARIGGVRHSISPSGWTMTLDFDAPTSVAAPQFTPSPPTPVPDVTAPTPTPAAKYVGHADCTASFTSSTTATDIAGMTLSVPVTSTDQKFLVTVVLDIQAASSVSTNFTGVLMVNGTAQATQFVVNLPLTALRLDAAQTWLITGLPVGTRVFKVQGRITSSTTNLYRVNTPHSSITVAEV